MTARSKRRWQRREKYLSPYPGYCFSDLQWLRECGVDGVWEMRVK